MGFSNGTSKAHKTVEKGEQGRTLAVFLFHR